MKTHPTNLEIRNARKARNEARRQYLAAVAELDATPDRNERMKSVLNDLAADRCHKYHVAQEAWNEITRRCNAYATERFNAGR